MDDVFRSQGGVSAQIHSWITGLRLDLLSAEAEECRGAAHQEQFMVRNRLRQEALFGVDFIAPAGSFGGQWLWEQKAEGKSSGGGHGSSEVEIEERAQRQHEVAADDPEEQNPANQAGQSIDRQAEASRALDIGRAARRG